MVNLHPDLIATHQIVRIMDTSLLFTRLVIDNQPQMLILVDEQARVLKINGTALAFLGKTKSEALGYKLDLLCTGLVRSQFRDLCKCVDGLNLSFFEETLDGKHHIHWKIRKLGDSGGRFASLDLFLISGDDTTELHKSQQAALDAEAKHAALQTYMKKELEARILVVSDLAHRINNPLNYISTSFHALQLELQKLTEDIRYLFEEVFVDADAIKDIYESIRKRLQKLESSAHVIEEGVDRASKSVAEIRSLSGVDGHQIDKISILKVFEDSLQRLFENVGQFWRQRLVIEDHMEAEAYVFSNRHALIVCIEALLRKWTQTYPMGLFISLHWVRSDSEPLRFKIELMAPPSEAWNQGTHGIVPNLNHLLQSFQMHIEVEADGVVFVQDTLLQS